MATGRGEILNTLTFSIPGGGAVWDLRGILVNMVMLQNW